MEDDFNLKSNKRQPDFFWKKEDHLNFLLNGRRFQFQLTPALPELGTAQPQLVVISVSAYCHNRPTLF
jgi:hypothetical protein